MPIPPFAWPSFPHILPPAPIVVPSVASEWWAPPAVADPISDEFTGTTLDLTKWTLSNVAGWAGLVSAGPVDSSSSPAAGTVRITVQGSWLYIQPALGLEVALRQAVTLNIGLGHQFSCRMRVAIPLAIGGVNDVFCSMNFAGAGATPDMTNRGEFSWTANGANNVTWFTQVISGGVQFGAIAGGNLAGVPMDAEQVMLITTQNVKSFLRSGTGKRYLLDQNIPNFAMPFTGHWVFRFMSANVASNNMPFAPIFAIDYARYLQSMNVL